MLVLSREPGEEFVIQIPGRERPMIIRNVGCRKSRMSFETDRDIIVWRREIYEAAIAESQRTGQPLTFNGNSV